MYQIIAPTLFQHKICRLPGIGTLMMVPKPAGKDFVHSQINAPGEIIYFRPEVNGDRIFNEFSAMAELMLQKLDEQGSVVLKGVGSFIKNEDGPIAFFPVPVEPILERPVRFERVIRENAEHAILVGDQQKTNVQMAEFYNEKPLLKQRWKMIALILGVIGLAILAFYFSRYGFNGLGNTRSI